MTRKEIAKRYRDSHKEQIAVQNAAYRHRPERREKDRERTARYRHSAHGAAVRLANNRSVSSDKRRAWRKVNRAVKSGLLEKTTCHCGNTRVAAHHPNGYDDEHVLDVVWLCSVCHAEAHRVANGAPKED